MPTLPSGLLLAIDKSSIMPPDTNWFRAPEGHFWYWTPAAENLPPFKPEDVWDAQPATAPVPKTIEEVKKYVRVVIGLPNGNMYWEGDHISDFPSHRTLSADDLEAWNEWIESGEIHQFLQEAVDDCVRQSIANKQASGVAVIKQTPDGQNAKEIVPPSDAVWQPIPEENEDEDQRYSRLLNASWEERKPLSDDDVQSIAVDIVMRYLKEKGATIRQKNTRARKVNLGASNQPAFLYEFHGLKNYVVVTSARMPEEAPLPEDPQAIIDEWSFLSGTGYWVGVSLAHELDRLDPTGEGVQPLLKSGLPLMRGFGVTHRLPAFVPLQELADSEAGK